MSRDYRAKRLTKELGIAYSEALRRIRSEGTPEGGTRDLTLPLIAATQSPQEKITIALTAAGEASGYPLLKATKLSPRRLYEALESMEAEGVITSRWEDMPRARRRHYRLAVRDA